MASRCSSLGVASRHALDAQRLDECGRKGLHRFVGGVERVTPEHLKRVVDSDPEAAGLPDSRGWYPLHYFFRAMGGDLLLDEEVLEDEMEQGLGTVEERSAPQGSPQPPPRSHATPLKKRQHFLEVTSLQEVRREYKTKLLQLHPDKNIGREADACAEMQQLQDEYHQACEKFTEPHPLKAACATGDAEQMLAVIEESLEYVDGEGNTFLHLLVKHSRDLSREQLSEAVARIGDISQQNNDGDTVLHVMLANHRLSRLDTLVDLCIVDEVATTANSEGRLPLHIACRYQRRRGAGGTLSILLRAAPIAAAAKDAFDWTPLHLFSQFQIDPPIAVLAELISAYPAAASARTCIDEDTPIHLACYALKRRIGTKSALELLSTYALASPESVLASCRANKRPWDHLPRKDPLFPACCAAIIAPAIDALDGETLKRFRDADNGTLLHVVAGTHGLAMPVDTCAVLVKKYGFDVNLRDDEGATPLDRLCRSPGNDDDFARARMDALVATSDLRDALDGCEKSGLTPLHRACAAISKSEAALAVVSRLLELRPDLAAQPSTEDWSFPAHLACSSCRSSISLAVPAALARLAAAAPAVAYQTDANGKHAWDYLPRHDELYGDCVKILLGHLVDRIDGDVQTAEPVLHLVCAHHQNYVVRALTARPREAYERDASGNTPLHLFVQHQILDDDLEPLKALLQANEEAVAARNHAGLTPVHVLCAHQKPGGPLPPVLARLVATKPEVAAYRCDNGDTPLSVLCRNNAETITADTPTNIKTLLDAAFIARQLRRVLERPCVRGMRPWDYLPPKDPRYAECCALLLPDVLECRGPLDIDGNTALHLLYSGAGFNLRKKKIDPRMFVDVASLNSFGATPLHCAAQFLDCEDRDDLDRFLELVDASPPSTFLIQSKSGWTPLMHVVHRYASAMSSTEQGETSMLPRLAFRAVLNREPSAVGVASTEGDTPLHIAAYANRKTIGPMAATLFAELVAGDTDAADRAAGCRGKAQRLPSDWLPSSDPFFGDCDEFLTRRAARCVELLLHRSGRRAASATLPESGEVALHQVCAFSPPVLTLPMLNHLLRANPKAPSTPRLLDNATPLHIFCRALSNEVATSAWVAVAPQLLRTMLQTDPAAGCKKDVFGDTPLDCLAGDELADCRAVFLDLPLQISRAAREATEFKAQAEKEEVPEMTRCLEDEIFSDDPIQFKDCPVPTKTQIPSELPEKEANERIGNTAPSDDGTAKNRVGSSDNYSTPPKTSRKGDEPPIGASRRKPDDALTPGRWQPLSPDSASTSSKTVVERSKLVFETPKKKTAKDSCLSGGNLTRTSPESSSSSTGSCGRLSSLEVPPVECPSAVVRLLWTMIEVVLRPVASPHPNTPRRSSAAQFAKGCRGGGGEGPKNVAGEYY